MNDIQTTNKLRDHFKGIPRFLLHPRQEFESQVNQRKATWLAPMTPHQYHVPAYHPGRRLFPGTRGSHGRNQPAQRLAMVVQ